MHVVIVGAALVYARAVLAEFDYFHFGGGGGCGV